MKLKVREAKIEEGRQTRLRHPNILLLSGG